MTKATSPDQISTCINGDLQSYSPSMYFRHYGFDLIATALNTVDTDAIDKAYDLLEQNFLHIWPVLTFGNGGSAAIANHIIADLVKGVGHDCFKPPVQAHSLVANSPLLTCMANDYGYTYALAKQIELWSYYGTLCIGISSSGQSSNIIQAFEAIKKRDLEQFRSIALVGFDGGEVVKKKLANVIIHVKSNNYGIVEDCHNIILHALTQKLRINNAKNISQIRL
jgi:D-sedoheptulose 7-phosphate isomerase